MGVRNKNQRSTGVVHMAVRKPVEKPKQSEAYIDKLISKGALVLEDIKLEEEKKNTHLNFRLPTEMLKKVDEALKDRVGISRNGWILEAIDEKLKKEKKS